MKATLGEIATVKNTCKAKLSNAADEYICIWSRRNGEKAVPLLLTQNDYNEAITRAMRNEEDLTKLKKGLNISWVS